MLETSWLWFVISKEYMELTRPKIESRDPIFFTGTRSRSRVSGNDRLFPRGSEFGPNLEIPAGPAIQLRPGPAYPCTSAWVHRSSTTKFVTPTALSCIDNSWRSTTLSPPKKLTSSTANLEWCHVHFIRDSYSTFIRRVIGPSKNSMELFCEAKFEFKSTWNRD